MDHKEARKRLTVFAAKLQWEVTPAKTRRDAQEWDAAHYLVILEGGSFVFNYSMGWGCFSDKQVKAVRTMRDGNTNETLFLYRSSRHTGSKIQKAIQRRVHEKFKPESVDILHSLLMDSLGSDVNFSDWCCELGYDDDSMKAKKIWETCNNHRRMLQVEFSKDDLESMYEFASEM